MRYGKTLIILIFTLAAVNCAVQGEEAGIKDARYDIDDIKARLAEEDITPAEKSGLLLEKARLLFMGLVSGGDIIAPTKVLIEAIETDPENRKAKSFLFRIYELFWKEGPGEAGYPPDTSGPVHEKVVSILSGYISDPNVKYLSGPYGVSSFLRRLNAQGKKISRGIGLEKDRVTGYITEHGWFTLEGSYAYYELYDVDINNDGVKDHVVTIMDGPDDSLEMLCVYTEKDGVLLDIFPDNKNRIKETIKTRLIPIDAIDEDMYFVGERFLFSREDGNIVFTYVITPQCGVREEFIDEECSFKYLWKGADLILKE